ncbi:Transposase DDE domain protein [Candidatus Methanoperedenaceae archaeon GB50]|nr:Transposase DDE domain protein [Candidatus Methanoperedenaceae archaeon GB37]CAD7770423.1 Transposase DDE domain protein [Candidatus Methanoperedenaceae archaeon GB50]CAD7772177.1 MAG: Transposase DDE domain protein [Candidatus Methanoperedenaceae archaeon GB50]
MIHRLTYQKRGKVVYRDKGYFGAQPEGYDATMKRATRGHPLDIRDELRNRRISKKRAPIERTFAVIKTVFSTGHVRVTTRARVSVMMIFTAFSFNLYHLSTIRHGEAT